MDALRPEYKPVCVFGECAVVFHFVCSPPELLPREGDYSNIADEHLDSIERDVLAYNCREDRPFRSLVLKPKEFRSLDICFPSPIIYSSEHEQFKHSNRKRRRCHVAASRTDFCNSIFVLNLAIVPDEDDSFDEIDIISLAKLWEGGESVGLNERPNCLHCNIHFEQTGSSMPKPQLFSENREGMGHMPEHTCNGDAPKKWLSIRSLATQFIDDHFEGEVRLGGGTIQIVDPEYVDDDGQCRKWEFATVFDTTKPGLEAVRMAVKGMETGLLDIGEGRVDTQELSDSLRGIKRMFDNHSEYAVANKGTVLVFSDRCGHQERMKHDVGANPYLWLPHTVAIYNEELLRRAAKWDKDAEKKNTEGALLEAEGKIRKLLYHDVIHDVFHYEHERFLKAACAKTRRLKPVTVAAKAKFASLTRKLEQLRDRRVKFFDASMQMLLALLTVATILGLYGDIRTFLDGHRVKYESMVLALCAIGALMSIGITQMKPTHTLIKWLPQWVLQLNKRLPRWVLPAGVVVSVIVIAFVALWVLEEV